MAREGEYAGVGSQMLAAAHGYSELLTPRPAGQSYVGAPRARHVLSFNSCEQQGTETLHQCICYGVESTNWVEPWRLDRYLRERLESAPLAR